MKTYTKTVALGLILIGGVAVAQERVENPLVKVRVDLMGSNGASAKVLGDMASGKVPFDAAAAAEAGGTLSGNAVQITEVFLPQETDPLSKAKPEIWTNWDDFAAKADGLFKATMALDTSTLEGVQAGMAGVGGACQACHKAYRN